MQAGANPAVQPVGDQVQGGSGAAWGAMMPEPRDPTAVGCGLGPAARMIRDALHVRGRALRPPAADRPRPTPVERFFSMRFHDCREGDYRIFVGALDAPRGQGYIAALVVNRERGMQPGSRAEAYRDESLACGYRWSSAEDALHYAVARARELIRNRSGQLAC